MPANGKWKDSPAAGKRSAQRRVEKKGAHEDEAGADETLAGTRNGRQDKSAYLYLECSAKTKDVVRAVFETATTTSLHQEVKELAMFAA